VGAFIALWIAQLVFGAIVYVTNPKREASSKAQSARSLAIYGGLVPCVGLMLFLQVLWLVLYRVQLAREDSVHRRYQSRLADSFGAPPSRGLAEPPYAIGNSSQADNPFL
jgi:hypothetical protein